MSNPMEVVKTRMQLQGELSPRPTRGPQPGRRYRNFAHAFYTIGRTEGLGGLQRGLGSGIWYQVFLNGPRLGLFRPLQEVFGATDATAMSFPVRNICAAATSGMIGACIGSPFYLVKARIQAASSVEKTNAQYAYNGMVDERTREEKKERAEMLIPGFVGIVDGRISTNYQDRRMEGIVSWSNCIDSTRCGSLVILLCCVVLLCCLFW